MKYNKPELIKLRGKLPPITTNFAPPPVENPDNPGDSEEEPLMQKKHKNVDETLNNKLKKNVKPHLSN